MPKDNNDDARNFFFFDARPRKFAKKRVSVESEGKKKMAAEGHSLRNFEEDEQKRKTYLST